MHQFIVDMAGLILPAAPIVIVSYIVYKLFN